MAQVQHSPSFPVPVGGASLLLAFKPQARTVLIIGSGSLAATRAFTALEADARVIVAGYNGVQSTCPEIQHRVKTNQVQWVDIPLIDPKRSQDWEQVVANMLDSLDDLMLVCVTDTIIGSQSTGITKDPGDSAPIWGPLHTAGIIARLCKARHIPINVTDAPLLCDFTFPATHRFASTSPPQSIPAPSPLQISITTNGQGCRLAGRIRREIVTALPKNIGRAVENVGALRLAAITEDHERFGRSVSGFCVVPRAAGVSQEEEDGSVALNAPVKQGVPEVEDPVEAARRRMRWVAQVSEYWPLERLAELSVEEMREVLQHRTSTPQVVAESGEKKRGCPRKKTVLQTQEPVDSDRPTGQRPHKRSGPTVPPWATPLSSSSSSDKDLNDPSLSSDPTSLHALSLLPAPPPSSAQGQILLVGSGPGHPSLLTRAAYTALTSLGTLILSDKLVPAQVLALIPKTTKLYIAKKYPGNAEGAQSELMDMALEGARRGEVVVRLKQGDPFVYGRGGEEVLFFRAHGFEPLVIPGVSSALAGPLLASIPVTQRGVAESVVICTGVGRGGKEVELPGYRREQSVCLLMGVARLGQIVAALTEANSARRSGARYPTCTPIAIIERASCPDQRIIASVLSDIEGVLEREGGELRPPAMMFVGWSCLALAGDEGDLSVLDDAAAAAGNEETLNSKDAERVRKWLGPDGYLVREGISDVWSMF